MAEIRVGKVINYFSKIGVAAINLEEGGLKVGDTIKIMGATTNFTQTVDSMQIEKRQVQEADRGASVGIKIKERARPNDDVYKIAEDS